MELMHQLKVTKKTARAFIATKEAQGYETRREGHSVSFRKKGRVSINFWVNFLDGATIIGIRPASEDLCFPSGS